MSMRMEFVLEPEDAGQLAHMGGDAGNSKKPKKGKRKKKAKQEKKSAKAMARFREVQSCAWIDE